MVWTAWCEANRALKEEKLAKPEDLRKGMKASWHLPMTLEKEAVMPYYLWTKGKQRGKAALVPLPAWFVVRKNKNGLPDLP